MSTNTVLMVNVQSGYASAADESQRRRTCMNPKTTSAWTDEQEEHCRGLVDTCRQGKVFWVSKHSGVAAEGGGKKGKKGKQQSNGEHQKAEGTKDEKDSTQEDKNV